MNENEIISTHDIDSLHKHFSIRFKKPTWMEWTASFLNGIQEANIPGTYWIRKVAVEIVRSCTVKKSYHLAAWLWLEPGQQPRTLENIKDVQASSALSHVPRDIFLRKLTEECMEFSKESPPLKTWGKKRVALLEYPLRMAKDYANDNNQKVGLVLRRTLITALRALPDKNKAIPLIKKTQAQALEIAAKEVSNILGKDGCSFSANLMVPIDNKILNAFRYHNVEYANNNFNDAERLFGPIISQSSKLRLIVIAETEKSEHLGFWVPVAQGTNNPELPGAPTTYSKHRGSAVFKNDLPELKKFPNEFANSWANYVRDKIVGELFVSLPFMVPTKNMDSMVVAAILNVNVNPDPPNGWERAYHDEWLLEAQKQAALYIETAFYSAMLALEAETSSQNNYPTLLIDNNLWNQLL